MNATRSADPDGLGRCCGTAGVLALAGDRLVETADEPGFAEVLVSDIADRAIETGPGVAWSNVEHRADPSVLEPRTGWAMGNAGIVRELLRYSRIRDGRDPGYAVPLPDQPAVSRPRLPGPRLPVGTEPSSTALGLRHLRVPFGDGAA
ncbi:MAG: hypothetical protein ACRD0P_13345 [Stackebrandtia sp.]